MFPVEKEIKNVVITGGAGFIGSHFIEDIILNTNWNLVILDSFNHKGTYSRLDDIDCLGANQERFSIFHHDLRAPLDYVLRDQIHYSFGSHGPHHDVDYIINLASNSAVERSISNPVECWNNNCLSIVNMLEYARGVQPKLFVQISTDEVYGDYADDCTDVLSTRGHKEWSRIKPSNPYAASKAAQEALCISYYRTYKTPIVICNTMNNIGERQDTEKFVPLLIKKIMKGEEVSIYVDDEGKIGSRVYLDAREHSAAVRYLIGSQNTYMNNHHLPPRFNVCGEVELDNLEMAYMVANAVGTRLFYNKVPTSSARPGYDKRYLLDGSLLKLMGFRSSLTIDDTVKRIVEHAKARPWF